MTTEIQNEMLILSLLSGFTKETNNSVKIEYLSGKEESRARKLLAETIRANTLVSRQIIESIADLFDPEPHSPFVERKLVFVRRTKGKPKNYLLHSKIANHVRSHLEFHGSTRKKDAIQSAQNKFNLSRSEVQRIYTAYTPFFKALGNLPT